MIVNDKMRLRSEDGQFRVKSKIRAMVGIRVTYKVTFKLISRQVHVKVSMF